MSATYPPAALSKKLREVADDLDRVSGNVKRSNEMFDGLDGWEPKVKLTIPSAEALAKLLRAAAEEI